MLQAYRVILSGPDYVTVTSVPPPTPASSRTTLVKLLGAACDLGSVVHTGYPHTHRSNHAFNEEHPYKRRCRVAPKGLNDSTDLILAVYSNPHISCVLQ